MGTDREPELTEEALVDRLKTVLERTFPRLPPIDRIIDLRDKGVLLLPQQREAICFVCEQQAPAYGWKRFPIAIGKNYLHAIPKHMGPKRIFDAVVCLTCKYQIFNNPSNEEEYNLLDGSEFVGECTPQITYFLIHTPKYFRRFAQWMIERSSID